jgi:hypothetical protein
LSVVMPFKFGGATKKCGVCNSSVYANDPQVCTRQACSMPKNMTFTCRLQCVIALLHLLYSLPTFSLLLVRTLVCRSTLTEGST